MKKTICEMHENLRNDQFIAFETIGEDCFYPLAKSDDFTFINEKTVLIRRKNGWNSIINLNLIVNIAIRRELF